MKKIIIALIMVFLLSSTNVYATDDIEDTSNLNILQDQEEVENEETNQEEVLASQETLYNELQTMIYQKGSSYYYNDNGTEKNGWIRYSGYQYFLDSKKGIMTNFNKTTSSGYIYANEYGVIQTNTLLEYDGDLYYIGDDGRPKFGKITYNNNEYYFQYSSSGLHKAQKDKVIWPNTGSAFYCNAEGMIEKNKLITTTIYEEMKLYYFDENGDMVTGWVTVDGNKYHFAEEGLAVYALGQADKGLTIIDNDIYYFDEETHIMKTGLTTVGNDLYYFSETGAAYKNGIYMINNEKYFFDENGIAQANYSIIIDDILYQTNLDCKVFNEQEINDFNYENLGITGLLYANTDIYLFDDNKQMVKNDIRYINNYFYYFDSNGKLYKNGWFTLNDNTYYSDTSTGRLYVGEYWIDADQYYFNQDAIMQTGIVEKQDGCYFYEENGKKSDGLQNVGNDYYYFTVPYGVMVKSQFVRLDGKIYRFAKTGKLNKSSWFSLNGKKYYSDDNGVIATGLTTIDGNKYYFDQDGVMQTGKKKIGSNEYFFDIHGQMVKSQFVTINGKIYRFTKTGALYTSGWFSLNGYKYYSNLDGVILTGLQEIDDEYYYFNKAGRMQFGKIKIDDYYYFFDPKGKMVKGQFIQIGLDTYRFASSGKLNISNWFNLSGKEYYSDSEGIIAIGSKNIDGIDYLFDETGILQNTGIVMINSYKYYFDENHNMTKSKFITIDGKIYRFASTGKLNVSSWFSLSGKKYYSDSNGVITTGLKTISNEKYYFDSTGAMQTGKIKIGSYYYYFAEDGKMVKSKFVTIDGKIYRFASTGKLNVSSWFSLSGKKYYSDSNGVIATGLKTISNEKYYFNSTGAMQTGKQKIGNDYYFFDENGKMVKSQFITINGEMYRFAKTGKLNVSSWFTLNGKRYYSDDRGVITIIENA